MRNLILVFVLGATSVFCQAQNHKEELNVTITSAAAFDNACTLSFSADSVENLNFTARASNPKSCDGFQKGMPMSGIYWHARDLLSGRDLRKSFCFFTGETNKKGKRKCGPWFEITFSSL